MSIYDSSGTALSAVYNASGQEIDTAYNADGYVIYTKSEPAPSPEPLDYSSYTTTDLFTYVADGFNGFDVYGGVIASLKASNQLYLFDLDSHELLRTNNITSSHGDSATFSMEFYLPLDSYPLLYCTADTTPAVIYVNRILSNSTTLIRTLKFPSSAGYYGAGAFDWDNNICYLVAYKENNFTSSNSGSNKTVVSKWDLSNLTDNGDGTYTPAFISQYERDFIYVMQGLQYHDGYIWIASGYNNGGAQHVYAMRPSDGVIEHDIVLDDTVEIEGLAWVYDETENKYWMLIGQQNGSAGINFSRIDFASAT